ncbi:MAG: DUF3843 family protein [Ignavibacteria bacterium]|nr:DUF3843 family protein [Ignavibacteria bacterium]
MKKNKDRIYIQTWLELKPYPKQAPTDSFYLKISNEVKQSIVTNQLYSLLKTYLDKEEIDLLSCFLTSYFEDIISGTNVWNTFVKHHKELYKKPLPFYNTEEYYEDEINYQDVCFLVWYFINTIQQEKFVVPFNNFIYEIAEKIYNIFDTAWDNAPENTILQMFYFIDEKETDYYIARNLIDTILFKTYLFYPDTGKDLLNTELEIVERNMHNENLTSFLNDNRDNSLHKAHTSLLCLTGKEWASEILGENHPLHNDFKNISQKIQGYFLYKGQNDNEVFIEHIASGRKFNLTKKSFDYSYTLKEIDTILFMGIVQWRKEWWFSGVYSQLEFDVDLVLDEKNSIESRMSVNFLDHQEQNVADIIKKQFDSFKDFNNGHQIAFVESEKINEFFKNTTEHYNASLNLPKKERDEAQQRAKVDGFFGGEKKQQNFAVVSASGLVFFNPNKGVEIALDVNSAFPLPNNPFYNKEESEEHTMRLLMAADFSKELVMFCIDNCKAELPFFNKKEGELYLVDIDFLLRFWKKGSYFSNPLITFTGK